MITDLLVYLQDFRQFIAFIPVNLYISHIENTDIGFVKRIGKWTLEGYPLQYFPFSFILCLRDLSRGNGIYMFLGPDKGSRDLEYAAIAASFPGNYVAALAVPFAHKPAGIYPE